MKSGRFISAPNVGCWQQSALVKDKIQKKSRQVFFGNIHTQTKRMLTGAGSTVSLHVIVVGTFQNFVFWKHSQHNAP